MPSFKVAKSGKNIPDIVDGRDYIFSTEFEYLKEAESGLVDTDIDGNLTIMHGLGYIPAFTVFVADYSDTSIWFPYDSIGNIYATSTSIVIEGAMGGIKSKVYYSLFSDQI